MGIRVLARSPPSSVCMSTKNSTVSSLSSSSNAPRIRKAPIAAAVGLVPARLLARISRNPPSSVLCDRIKLTIFSGCGTGIPSNSRHSRTKNEWYVLLAFPSGPLA